jgi:hypothetical protein
MDYFSKLLRKISIKAIIVHFVGLVASMSVVWGVSYWILVTFSIQENPVVVTVEPIQHIKISSSTAKSKIDQATTTSPKSKSKK